jgi:hypothetical protein
MNTTKKIAKGWYKIIDTTLGDQGWRIDNDPTLEGQLKWRIYNVDDWKTDDFIMSGEDQLWATLNEAEECLQDYLTNL